MKKILSKKSVATMRISINKYFRIHSLEMYNILSSQNTEVYRKSKITSYRHFQKKKFKLKCDNN